MQGKDVVKLALRSTQDVLAMYLSDLSDQDLAIRPVAAANNIAWQLAHIIMAEKYLLGADLPEATYPAPPAAIASLGSERTGKVDPPEGYLSKSQYLEWFGTMRAATLAAVDKLTDADLDRPTVGPMKKMAPTLGALLILTANHTLMHGGQFTVVRRALGKPVMF